MSDREQRHQSGASCGALRLRLSREPWAGLNAGLLPSNRL